MNKTIKNNILSRIVNSVFLLVLFSVLSACGGGGGGAPAPTATIGDVSVAEGDSGTTDLVFTVSLTAAAGSNATVDYATSDDTAVAGQDYTATSGTLSIPSGGTSATITVTVATDTTYEADETLTMTLSSPSGLTLGTSSAATGTITNDDSANPKGYFTGTATVNSTTVAVTGLAYDHRLLMFSTSGTPNVLYDIALSTITATDFSNETVHVYVNGSENGETVTVTGTTNDSQISGTFSGGSGLASGTFNLLYDTANNRAASLARIETSTKPNWSGDIYTIEVDVGQFLNDSGDIYGGGDSNDEFCAYIGTLVIPPEQVNIYELSHNIAATGTCTAPYASNGHTGFAAVIDGMDTDDTLIYAFANGAIGLYAVMTR